MSTDILDLATFCRSQIRRLKRMHENQPRNSFIDGELCAYERVLQEIERYG